MQQDKAEKQRLLNYFKHRQFTFVSILKECYKARKANGGTHCTAAGTVDNSNAKDESQKIFKLVNKNKQVENLTQEQVDKRAQDAIKQFRKDNKVDSSKKIFIVLGQYHEMRNALLAKDWVENPVSSFEELPNTGDYRVHAFHFLYTTKSKDAFRW